MKDQPHNWKTKHSGMNMPSTHTIPQNRIYSHGITLRNWKQQVSKQNHGVNIRSSQQHNAHAGSLNLNQGVQTETSVLELKFQLQTRQTWTMNAHTSWLFIGEPFPLILKEWEMSAWLFDRVLNRLWFKWAIDEFYHVFPPNYGFHPLAELQWQGEQ